MKKLSAVAIAFVMAVSLCACAAQEKGFEPDLSYWSNPKENTDTLPFYYRGNGVSTSADGVDTGGQSLAELIESTALTPVENIDLSKYDIPQHIYQAEFIKYHDTKMSFKSITDIFMKGDGYEKNNCLYTVGTCHIFCIHSLCTETDTAGRMAAGY